MCGIVGFIDNTFNRSTASDVLGKMTSAIVHRGPDDMGVWFDEGAHIGLGHQRLSILDLSHAGHQPMESNTGRFVMVFNGEIYNHLQLRSELEQERIIEWRGHSDTETLLAGFEAWGVAETLTRTVGMFAIALWDKQQRTLYLARDRFGEKPLYYGWINGAFVFGSELKALRAYPHFSNPVNREALTLYMRFTYIPAPYSIYKAIYKLEPGCLLSITGNVIPSLVEQPLRPFTTHENLTLRRWWSLKSVVEEGNQRQFTDETTAMDILEQCLQEAVRLQSLADVPLGAFLSGGIDSSLIVALMQQQTALPVKTFTVGFEEAGFDESPHAKAVAQHLGTDHHELFVSALEAQAVIPHLGTMYDEPFADSSQIPTHLVCKAARQHVTVALSGDAGDELFGGYNRYFWGPRIWNRISWLPYPIRQALGTAITSISIKRWDTLISPITALMSDRGIARGGEKVHKLAKRLSYVQNIDDLYRSLVSEWQDPANVVRHAVEPASLLDDLLPIQGADHDQLKMMYRDSMTYLPDDILCKVDRAAMAASLETRVPFLDHRVAELAWKLPLEMRIRGNQGKWALRQVLYKYVPRELIERPKTGFSIPIGEWLRGPLREWAEALLDEHRLLSEGYFYPAPIRQKWSEHLNGYDHTPSLWAVLMFQAWLENTNT